MKVNKRTTIKIIVCLILFFTIFIGINTIKSTFSLSDEVSVEVINNNINSLNEYLKTVVETNNPYFYKEILDDNGNVPAYSYYPTQSASREINYLKAFDDKIFIGLGDYDTNTGPVKIIYYDTIKDKIGSSGTIPDEEVLSFNIIDDKLYTTGADPRDDWGYGSYYIYNKQDNNWLQNRINSGWVHIFDIEKHNNKLFMCGSVLDSYKRSTIQSSIDGVNFNDVPVYFKDGTLLPYDSNLRCYKFIRLNNKLYANFYYSTYNGIYEYDEINNRFDYISNLPSIEINLTKTAILNDEFIYVSLFSNTIITKDFKKYNYINDITPESEKDFVTVGDTLYILALTEVTEDNEYIISIFKTKDLVTSELVYEFTGHAYPSSIEYYDNSFYIGTDNGKYSVEKYGAMYRVDLNKAEKKVELDKENKTFKITKDAITYPVSYELYQDESIFETTLTFNKNMTEKEWLQEYTKLKNLSLIYALFDNKQKTSPEYSIKYFEDSLISKITSTETHSSAIEFANVTFNENLNIIDDRFNITSNIINKDENSYKVSIKLVIPNIDKIESDKYTINEKEQYIYIGNEENEENIKNNISINNLLDIKIDLINNKIILEYQLHPIKEYKIIRFTTNKAIKNNSIYIGNLTDNEAILEFNVFNGNKTIQNNKLQIKYNNTILDEYFLERFSSDKTYFLDNLKAYISTNSINEIKSSLNLVDLEADIYDDRIEIKKNGIIYETFKILKINFKNFKVSNKELIIPKNYFYEDLINEIIISPELNYKIFENNSIISSGILNEDMLLKIYYNDVEIDTFYIKTEYLEFDETIIIDNMYLDNIAINTTKSQFLNKINTNGMVTLKNNNNDLINDMEFVGTGSKLIVELILNKVEYTIIVRGDIDGNGLLNMTDILKMGNHIYKNQNELNEVYVKAIDFDKNSIYNLEDIMKSAKIINGGAE